MKITSGEYELIYSGQVISIKDNPIEVVLPDEVEGDFKFIFKFIKDESVKGSQTRRSAKGKFELEISFLNFDGFTGGGNAELLEVGTLKNQNLFLNYRVFDLVSGKTILFNFYLKKGV